MNTQTQQTEPPDKKEFTPQEASRLLREHIAKFKPEVEQGDDSRLKILVRYPRLTAHLICESLGYFTPFSAARAIEHYRDGQPFFCEWYCSMAGKNRDMVAVGKQTLARAVQYRHGHKGYMAEYWQGRKVCLQTLAGNAPTFASWF